jgi:hypothetical protein
MASGGMIDIPSFMTIGLGMQVTSRFFFDNLRGCSVDITDGRDL